MTVAPPFDLVTLFVALASMCVVGGALWLTGRRDRGRIDQLRRQHGVAVERPVTADLVVGVAALSLAAAALHAPGVTHPELPAALFFAVVTLLQTALAAGALTGALPRLAPMVIAGNVLLIATWLATRTVGWPAADGWEREGIGLADTLAVLYEALVVGWLLLGRDALQLRVLRWSNVTAAGRAFVVVVALVTVRAAVDGH